MFFMFALLFFTNTRTCLIVIFEVDCEDQYRLSINLNTGMQINILKMQGKPLALQVSYLLTVVTILITN